LLRLFVLLFAVSSLVTPTSTLYANIKIGAWNIGNALFGLPNSGGRLFGLTKASRPAVVDKIAQVSIRYDAIFYTEVGNPTDAGCAPSTTNVHTGIICKVLTRMNALAGAGTYQAYFSPPISGGGLQEKYGVIYKPAFVSILTADSFVYAGSVAGVYARRPHIVRLSVDGGGTTFYVVNLHTSNTGNTVGTEIMNLPYVANDLAAGTNIGGRTADSDIIILGDFNADVVAFNDFPTGVNNWINYYARFTPNASPFWDGGRPSTMIPDGSDTNLSFSDASYDRISVSPSMMPKVNATSAGVK